MKHIYIALGMGIAFFFGYVGIARAQTCYVSLYELGGTCGAGSLNGNVIFTSTSSSAIVGGASNEVDSNDGFIGGGELNVIYPYADYSTICGGYSNSVVAASGDHSSYAFIGGGESNRIQESTDNYTDWGAIAGGRANTITGSNYAFIGGGYSNSVGDGSVYATIGGGDGNTVDGEYAFTGGGDLNFVDSDSTYSTICGGQSNSIEGGFVGISTNAFIGGGGDNSILGAYGAIGGGQDNEIDLEVTYGTIPGGKWNTVGGNYSFAAGENADADQDNCFVWSDGTGLASQTCVVGMGAGTSEPNAFVVRATGGVEFVTATTSGSPSAGNYITGGTSGWNNVSDYNAKYEVQEVDPREVLEHLLAVPVATWKFRADPRGTRFMGPMAQDFYAAFKLGNDDRSINDINSEGVALAAIKGVYSEVLRKDEALRALEQANAEANRRVASLEQANADANRRVVSLEHRLEQIEAQLGLSK